MLMRSASPHACPKTFLWCSHTHTSQIVPRGPNPVVKYMICSQVPKDFRKSCKAVMQSLLPGNAMLKHKGLHSASQCQLLHTPLSHDRRRCKSWKGKTCQGPLQSTQRWRRFFHLYKRMLQSFGNLRFGTVRVMVLLACSFGARAEAVQLSKNVARITLRLWQNRCQISYSDDRCP